MSVYYKKNIITLVFKSMSQAMLKISNVLFCVFTPRPSVQMKIERDHITLGGKIIISLTWAEKNVVCPLRVL